LKRCPRSVSRKWISNHVFNIYFASIYAYFLLVQKLSGEDLAPPVRLGGFLELPPAV